MKKQISLIVAMSHDRVIGLHNKMPWHLPGELAYFKHTTLGKTVVMGRKTFDSIGHALPHRRNIIISKQMSLIIPGCEVYSNLDVALENATHTNDEEIMIIGGASLFTQTLPIAKRLYLTLIDAKLPGDTFFPEWNKAEWQIITNTYHQADQKNSYSFYTQVLERICT